MITKKIINTIDNARITEQMTYIRKQWWGNKQLPVGVLHTLCS